MRYLFNRVVREEHGQDLVEYALLAALISIASVAVITALGTSIRGAFDNMATSVTTAGS